MGGGPGQSILNRSLRLDMFNSIQFSSFSEFLEMGGYAFNVWSVYALFIVFLAANLLIPMRRNKQIRQDIKRRIAINEDRNQSNSEVD